jgi:hypothetical protein
LAHRACGVGGGREHLLQLGVRLAEEL